MTQLLNCDLCNTPLTPADSETVCQACEAREERKYDLALYKGMMHAAIFRPDNTPGYTTTERAAMNTEFDQRWLAGDWAGVSCEEAVQQFCQEIAQR